MNSQPALVVKRTPLRNSLPNLGAAFLCAELGLSNEPRPDHAAYLASWLRVLKNDKRAIFTTASKAQAAVDYMHGKHEEERLMA